MPSLSQQQLHQQLIESHSAGHFDQAEWLANQLLAQDPDDAAAGAALALILSSRGMGSEAKALLQRVVRLHPQDAQSWYNLGVVCQEKNHTTEAMNAYRGCLQANPAHNDALWNYSELLRGQQFFKEAANCLEQLLLLEQIPRPDLQHRLAVCYAHLGKYPEAEHWFSQALMGNSSSPASSHWERAHHRLALGDYAGGWDDYEYRFNSLSTVACHDFGLPIWQGESLAGKTLLVHGEQGLGDEIMFASIINELAAECDELILACQTPLLRLFAQSFPSYRVLRHDVGRNPAHIAQSHKIDFSIPLGSLARFRRRSAEDFNGQPYLGADADEMLTFSQLLQTQTSDRHYRVGVMWGSNPAHGVDWGAKRAQRKSIPIAELNALGNIAGLQWISLQNYENAHQAAFAPGLNLLDVSDHLQDLASTAALMMNLDLVITVDTSIAHLAGSLGLPTWVLVMKDCDWRWLREGEDSAWYQSVRLIRQQHQGDWIELTMRLQGFLTEWVNEQDQAREQ
ncbi:MAG: hypothetical protein ACI8P9_000331 [Parasphingorhabdus sp.]|jgi:hypothetical protein